MLVMGGVRLKNTNKIKHQALSTNLAAIFLILKVSGKRVVNMIHTKLQLNCLLNYYFLKFCSYTYFIFE